MTEYLEKIFKLSLFSFCLQSITTCQCLNLQNRYTSAQRRSVNNSICGNQTLDTENIGDVPSPNDDLLGFRTAYCLLTVDKSGTDDCPCHHPCQERLYTSTVSASSPWPDPAFQQDFYDRFIRDKKYAYKFKEYGDVVDAYNNGSLSSVSSRFTSLRNSKVSIIIHSVTLGMFP
jgi:Amiloride-sensitive sodium channel